MAMSKPARINRRQWLKAAGATAAGVVLSQRLPGAGMADGVVQASQGSVFARGYDATGCAAPPLPGVEQGERRYIHGFEPYPGL